MVDYIENVFACANTFGHILYLLGKLGSCTLV